MWYIYIIALIGGGILALRTIFGIIYVLVESCKKGLKKDRVKARGPKKNHRLVEEEKELAIDL